MKLLFFLQKKRETHIHITTTFVTGHNMEILLVKKEEDGYQKT